MSTLNKFEYLAPSTIEEAVSLLDEYGEKAEVIAGGTDLIPKLKEKELSPDYMIDVSKIDEMDYIREEDEILKIGALTTHSTLGNSPIIDEKVRILADAAHEIGSVQIRNRGTIGGNLANASPAADTATPLLALEASLKLESLSGNRVVSIDDFFVDSGESIIDSDELLTEIQVSNHLNGKTRGAFIKLGRRSEFSLSIVNVAVVIGIKKGKCEHARIALGACGSTPIRVKEVEDFLEEKALDESTIKEAAKKARGEISPISDVRSSAEYREEIAEVLIGRALKEVAE